MSARALPTQGNLKEHSVTRLLQIALEEELSGSLTVSRGSVSRTLFFKKGMITYASSTESQDRLGEIFIIQGKLTRAEVVRAFKKAQRKNTLVGRVLLVDSLITSQELFLAVSAQVVAIMERMKSWRKGDFVFDVGNEPEEGTVLLRIPLSLYLGVEEKKKKKSAPRKKEGPQGALARKEVAPPEEEYPEELEFDAEEEEELTIDDQNMQTVAEDGEESPQEAEESGQTEADAVEQTRLIEEIVFNIQEVRRRSGRGARTLLGVSDEATLPEVQEAYYYLARLLHPDQHPQRLPQDAAQEASELFQEISAAYHDLTASLKEPSRPASSAASISTPGRLRAPAETMVGGDDTRRLFYKAKEQIAKGNYWQATDSLRQVVRKKPREAMYRNLLGYCLMQTGRRLHEAEEHIKEAIRLDPGNPDYITNLGLVYKAGRFYSKAKDMFQQALLYDKRHEMARRELRIASRMVDPGGGKPLWKKIFGG
jgi:tetratricopeptide (TPR) repeat protein